MGIARGFFSVIFCLGVIQIAEAAEWNEYLREDSEPEELVTVQVAFHHELRNRNLHFVGNTPFARKADGTQYLDVEKFNRIVGELPMVTFRHLFLNKGMHRNLYRKKFESLLSNMRADGPEIYVDDSLGRPVRNDEITTSKDGKTVTDKLMRSAPSRSALKELIRDEALAQIREVAELSTRYPKLIGYYEDDFLAKRKADTMLDREFFRKVCREARAINPNFKFGVVLYCIPDPAVGDSEKNFFIRGFMKQEVADRINFASPTRQVEAFLEYIKDPEINGCIDAVSLYNMGEGALTEEIRDWQEKDVAITQQCLDLLEPTDKKIELGVYASGFPQLDYAKRVSNIELALKTSAKDLVFFMTPIKPFTEDATEEQVNVQVFNYLVNILKP